MWKLADCDRVGIGWRPELAPSILSNLDQIDVVEVIVDDYFLAPRKRLRSLKTLSQQVPVIYHGVTLGLASSHAVDESRLNFLARTLGYLEPVIWSEHLAFVRAAGQEIGHLAAPPRTEWTIEGAYKNLRRIEQVVGSRPILENIATLINPPGSTLKEGEWVSEILSKTNTHLLLDLHNLYSNARNFGFDPIAYLQTFPLEQVRLVHLSGGRWIKEPPRFAKTPGSLRLLDDHVHDVPNEVFDLLKVLATEVTHPLTVIIERDGEYPEFQSLLNQAQAARSAITEGRLSNRNRIEAPLERPNL